MKLKTILLLFLILLLVSFVVYFIFISHIQEEKYDYKEACIKNRCFVLELAKTPQELENGLMFRDFLPEDKGMLFIFPQPGKYSFWMKNTIIPLDIIWINNNKIVYIKKNALPCNISCPSIDHGVDANYVLEINAQFSDKYNFSVGDEVNLN